MLWTLVLEKTLESPLDCKEIQAVHPKGDQPWVFIGRTDAEDETPVLLPPEELTHWKRPWCWKRLKTGGEGDDRGWDGSIASLSRWPWVWVSSRSWWWTGRPVMLQYMGLQRVGHKWVTTELIFVAVLSIFCYVWYFYWNTGNLVKLPFCFIYPTFPFAEDEAPILWAPYVKSSLIGKESAAGKNWG